MRIALLVIVGVISACSKTPQDEFSAAWLKGQYNEQFSRKGGTYVRQMVGSLGPALTASEAECGVKPKEAPQRCLGLHSACVGEENVSTPSGRGFLDEWNDP